MKKAILPVLLATLWIGFSEFLRNQLLFISYWENHYNNMGLIFPSKPLNGMIWMLWSLVFATTIYVLSKKLSTQEAIAVAWVMGFMLMWLTIGNLGVLPFRLLWFAIPLSIIEVIVAVHIIQRVSKH